MNKRDVIAVVAREAGIKKVLAGKTVDSVLRAIRKNAKKGIQIIGFGSFSVVKRRARKCKNPRTGATFTVKASNIIKFRPGTDFKQLVN
ncbi:MAG TPA: HU family DNA-binding protein [Chitinivibrionales bacterium]|nr:HU family DNA-binding protein [Chitinivibrionales bacterium]